MFKDATTRSERMRIDGIMDGIITNIDIGCKLISDSYEEYFGSAEQKDIHALDAERLGRVVYSAFWLISDAVAEYYAETGHYTEESVHNLIRRGQRAAQVIEVERRVDEARAVLPLSTIRRISDMPDAAALAYLDEQEAKAGAKENTRRKPE